MTEQQPIEYIPVVKLCETWEIEVTFFEQLEDAGLITTVRYEETRCVHRDALGDVERIIRLRRELDLNVEGIDVVFNLLERIEELKGELVEVRSRLRGLNRE